jgi:uncharacterized protein HemX
MTITTPGLDTPPRAAEARPHSRHDGNGSSERPRPRGRSTLTLSLLLVAALAFAVTLAGCGQSAQDKAKSQVCSARADINKQLQYLKGLTITTATATGVQNSLKAIGSDLNKIKDAQPQLDSQRKQQVQSANQAFSATLQAVASNIGQNLSISNAGAQLKSAVGQLTHAYQTALAPISCS